MSVLCQDLSKICSRTNRNAVTSNNYEQKKKTLKKAAELLKLSVSVASESSSTATTTEEAAADTSISQAQETDVEADISVEEDEEETIEEDEDEEELDTYIPGSGANAALELHIANCNLVESQRYLFLN